MPATTAKPKKDPGRPTGTIKPKGERMKNARAVKLSDDDLALIEHAAELDRRPVGQWMRDRLLLAARQEVEAAK